MLRRMVLVATGSGIGPCAHVIFSEGRIPLRVLLTSPDVRETFGDELVNQIPRYAPDTVFYDTHKHGKSDVVSLLSRWSRNSQVTLRTVPSSIRNYPNRGTVVGHRSKSSRSRLLYVYIDLIRVNVVIF